jgi:glycerol uptake facilitator
MNHKCMESFVGEALGTFILVFFGCGAIAVSVLFSAHQGLFQIAAIWGVAVTLAIYVSRHLSCAHINPAVSLAMVLAKRMSIRKLPLYILGQFTGAFIAGACVYMLFSNSIAAFEAANAITRGSEQSLATAMIFGEYFPNPASGIIGIISLPMAAFVEGLGTFMLVLIVFLLTEECNLGRPSESFSPVFIGAAVTIIISVIAPLTQAGINPARDFGPRLFSYFAGWGDVAIPGPKNGFFIVYIFSPLIGGIIASLFFSKCLEPLMARKTKNVITDDCCK